MITLPKLKKINPTRNAKKIFLLTDDISSPSGVGTVAREIVNGTCHIFDWVQLAAAIQHPHHGKIIDMSDQIEQETGKTDVYVKLYGHNGYFSPDSFFQIFEIEKPDAIMLFTDPRHYMNFWPFEHIIRSELKIPIIYYSIWDSELVPNWNAPFYESCDMLLAINKQTDIIHKQILNTYNLIHSEQFIVNRPICGYIPHGINPNTYYPISNDPEFQKFEDDFKNTHDVDFVVYWNSRNIRRKQPGDVILGFKKFCDSLPLEQSKKCILVMKTHVQDPNGTDLMSVYDHICPEYKVLFIEEHISSKLMNYFYNLADVTISMSSAEGFGLSIAESIMAGTMVISPVHGGLQDQMGFDFIPTIEIPSNCTATVKSAGEWVLPMFPVARQLQGSLQTPYIYDYVVNHSQLSFELKKCYDFGKKERNRRGLVGRDWLMSDNSKMTTTSMSESFIEYLNHLFANWRPKPRYVLEQVKPTQKTATVGIL